MTTITDTQVLSGVRELIDDEISLYSKGTPITIMNEIPDTGKIPLDDPKHWLRIPEIICVYVDMLGSTLLSAKEHDKSTAKTFRFFTATAIKFFHHFKAPYIDVKGDGVFALFNQNQVYRALVSAVTFKTFADVEFTPRVKQDTNLPIGAHIGIAQRTVLVKRLGLRRRDGRTDRQNEVWAGKPVNMAAKLASLTKDGELYVSERYYEKLKDSRATHSCICPNGERKPLWKEVDVSMYDHFDFEKVYCLNTRWCEVHGKEYATGLLGMDR